MKPSTFVVIVGVIVLAFVFGQCRGVAKASENREADSLKSVLNDSVPAWIALAEAAAVAVVETTIVVRERIVRDVARADSAAQAAATGAAALRVELTTAHRSRLDSIVGSFEAAIADLNRALERANRIIALERGQKETEQALNQQFRTALAKTQELWERSRRRNKTCGLGAAFGFGGTLSGGTLYTGPSVTVGVSCRVALPFP